MHPSLMESIPADVLDVTTVLDLDRRGIAPMGAPSALESQLPSVVFQALAQELQAVISLAKPTKDALELCYNEELATVMRVAEVPENQTTELPTEITSTAQPSSGVGNRSNLLSPHGVPSEYNDDVEMELVNRPHIDTPTARFMGWCSIMPTGDQGHIYNLAHVPMRLWQQYQIRAAFLRAWNKITSRYPRLHSGEPSPVGSRAQQVFVNRHIKTYGKYSHVSPRVRPHQSDRMACSDPGKQLAPSSTPSHPRRHLVVHIPEDHSNSEVVMLNTPVCSDRPTSKRSSDGEPPGGRNRFMQLWSSSSVMHLFLSRTADKRLWSASESCVLSAAPAPALGRAEKIHQQTAVDVYEQSRHVPRHIPHRSKCDTAQDLCLFDLGTVDTRSRRMCRRTSLTVLENVRNHRR